jgi:hypothetical protein
MFDREAANRDIEARNRLRAESHLPTLSVTEELARMEQVHRQREIDDFVYGSPLRAVVQERLLQRHRVRRGDANWTPQGFLSGGGFAFNHAVSKRMLRLWRWSSRRTRNDFG